MSKKNTAKTTLTGIIAGSALALSGCGTTSNVESRVSAAGVSNYAPQSQMAGNQPLGIDGNYIKASVEVPLGGESSYEPSLHLDFGNQELDGTDVSFRASYNTIDNSSSLIQRMQLPSSNGTLMPSTTIPLYDPNNSFQHNSLLPESVPAPVRVGLAAAAVAGGIYFLASDSGSSSNNSSEVKTQEEETKEEKAPKPVEPKPEPTPQPEPKPIPMPTPQPAPSPGTGGSTGGSKGDAGTDSGSGL